MRAAGAGTVVMVANHFFGGNAVFVDHGDGLVTQYFHLSRIDVREGQQLVRGAALGRSAPPGAPPARTCTSGCAFRGARVDPGAAHRSPWPRCLASTRAGA